MKIKEIETRFETTDRIEKRKESEGVVKETKEKFENEEKKMKEEVLAWGKLIQNEVIYSNGRGELRGWEQPNNVIVLFAGEPGNKNVEDYPQTLQFPKAAIPSLIAFLGRVEMVREIKNGRKKNMPLVR